MIPEYYIKEWHEQVPWNTDTMSEHISTKICVNKIGNTGSSYINITTQ